MPGLLDIAPPEVITETFEIRGGSITVHGIRNRDWAVLLRRFPELRRQVAGGAAAIDEDMTVANIEIVLAVIAAGLGNPGDLKTEGLIFERLTDAEQSEVFGTIMRLTAAAAPLAESPAAQAGRDGNGKAATI